MPTIRKVTKKERELTRQLFEEMRKNNVKIDDLTMHDMSLAVRLFAFDKLNTLENFPQSRLTSLGSILNNVLHYHDGSLDLPRENLSEVLRVKYKFINYFVETLDSKELSVEIYSGNLSMKFFTVAIKDGLLTPTHPYFEQIKRGLCGFSPDVSEEMKNRILNYFSAEYSRHVIDREILLDLYESNYRFVKENFSLLNTTREFDILDDPEGIIELYDCARTFPQHREKAENYLVNSVVALVRFKLNCDKEAIEKSALKDSNLPSSSFSDTNLCELAENRINGKK